MIFIFLSLVFRNYLGVLGLGSMALISTVNILLIDFKILRNSYFSYKLLKNVINITPMMFHEQVRLYCIGNKTWNQTSLETPRKNPPLIIT